MRARRRGPAGPGPGWAAVWGPSAGRRGPQGPQGPRAAERLAGRMGRATGHCPPEAAAAMAAVDDPFLEAPARRHNSAFVPLMTEDVIQHKFPVFFRDSFLTL